MRAVSAIIEANKSRCDARTSSGVSNPDRRITVSNHTPKHHNLPLLEFTKAGNLKRHVAEALFDLGLKYCPSCQTVKTLGSFQPAKGRFGGVRGWCKPCKSLKSQKEYLENDEAIKARSKNYRDTHKEELAQYHARYKQQNKDKVARRHKKYQQANATKIQEYKKGWRKSNRDKVYASLQNRRAMKKSAEGTHTADDTNLLWEQQGGCCAYCGCELTLEYRHLDHVIPLSRGGSNWPSNLAWACPPCNLSKNDKLLEEWLDG